MSLQLADLLEEKPQITGLFKQVLVGLIDVGLVYGLVSAGLIFRIPPVYLPAEAIGPVPFIVLLLVLYRLLSFTLFHGTAGMKLFGLILLNGEQQSLSLPEKVLASVFILYRGVAYYNRPGGGSRH